MTKPTRLKHLLAGVLAMAALVLGLTMPAQAAPAAAPPVDRTCSTPASPGGGNCTTQLIDAVFDVINLMVTAANNSKEENAEFTQKTAAKLSETFPGFNVMVFKTMGTDVYDVPWFRNEYTADMNGVLLDTTYKLNHFFNKEDQTDPAGYDVFRIWVFQGDSTFRNRGDGGYMNWAFVGHDSDTTEREEWICGIGSTVQYPCGDDVRTIHFPSRAGYTHMTGSLTPDAAAPGYHACLDVNGNGAENGTPVQMWECNGSDAQKWTYNGYKLQAANGKCLDLAGNQTANGSRLQIWDCLEIPGQRWHMSPSGTLRNMSHHSDRSRDVCVDDLNGQTANGSPVVAWACGSAEVRDAPHQNWNWGGVPPTTPGVPGTTPGDGEATPGVPGTTPGVPGTDPGGEEATPGVGTNLTVMPLGDSITVGVGSTTRTGYRPLLARRLAETTDKARFVGSVRDAEGARHEGHSGWRVDQIQENVGRWLADAKPQVVLLHIGTNDMDRDYQVSTAPQRLGALLDSIHAASPDTAVVVASLVPAADAAVQARVTAYNRAIPGIVADRVSRGHRVTQVSMDTLTTADLDDRLHPNNNGYRKMAESFLGGIATVSRNGWIAERIEVKPLPDEPPTTVGTAGDYDVDINGDGRADYLVVEDNGAVRAYVNTARADGTIKWTDQGYIASGSAAWRGDQVRFADISGDSRADYLVVDPKNGSVRAFVNKGGDGRGGWDDRGVVATGSSAWGGDQVRFADISGDGRADYLAVEPNGATRAFVSTTDATTGAIKWTGIGYIASGSSAWHGDQVRFADIGGDSRADYLVVAANGALRAFVNEGGNGRGGWDDRGVVATGSSAWGGDQVRFADISGDGRGDYLVVEPNGAIRAFVSLPDDTTRTVKWNDQGVIATGTGAPSDRVRI
ncbi:GDSL-type esterase/lipase family protein [Streptomyces hydrogenans]